MLSIWYFKFCGSSRSNLLSAGGVVGNRCHRPHGDGGKRVLAARKDILSYIAARNMSSIFCPRWKSRSWSPTTSLKWRSIRSSRPPIRARSATARFSWCRSSRWYASAPGRRATPRSDHSTCSAARSNVRWLRDRKWLTNRWAIFLIGSSGADVLHVKIFPKSSGVLSVLTVNFYISR